MQLLVLMSYIKKAGPKALAVLGKLKSQGKKTFQKVFAGAESLSSFGIDLFSDVSSTIWKYGKGLSDKAKEIGLKTKEQVKDLIEWVGDNVPDLVSSDSGHLGPLIGKYKPAPKNIEAFQGLTLAKRKTRSMGGGLRKRWKDSSGNIYEWDSMHGRVEKYNKKGRHLGEFDSKTGTQTKPADPSRRVEP